MRTSQRSIHVARSIPRLLALGMLAWIPAVATMAFLLVTAGPAGIQHNLFWALVATNLALVAGFGFAVPAMMRVLHLAEGIRAAARGSLRRVRFNILVALPAGLFAIVGSKLWPEVFETVAETLMVEAIIAMPVVVWCQVAWMQQVADGDDDRQLLGDATWVVTRQRTFTGVLALVYAACWVIAMPLLVPIVSGPVAIIGLTIPYVVASWVTWLWHTGARPRWEDLDRLEQRSAPAARDVPVEPEQAAVAAAEVHADSQPVAAARSTEDLMPIKSGDGCTHIALETRDPGRLVGAWVVAGTEDTLTCSVRVPGADGGDWSVLMWHAGGTWRELDVLWNDGRHIVAHGVPRADRTFVAVRRNDGEAGYPFDMWISIATSRAAEQLPDAA